MDTIDLTKANLSMRIPTNGEWDRLMDSVSGDDAVVHWMDIFSWTEDWKVTSGSVRWVRGFSSAYARSDSGASYRGNIVGFRPAFDLDTDILPSGIQYGDAVIVGTLYMDGRPVKIPQKPSYNPRDIADYIPGAKLEMRPALAAPAYQVTGIFVDGSIVADRCILKNISYRDVKSAIKRIGMSWKCSPLGLIRNRPLTIAASTLCSKAESGRSSSAALTATQTNGPFSTRKGKNRFVPNLKRKSSKRCRNFPAECADDLT